MRPLVAALVVWPWLAAAQSGGPPALLHEIEVVASGAVGETLDGVRVELDVHPDAEQRPNPLLSRGGATRVSSGRWLLDTKKYPGGRDVAAPAHVAATFLVDYGDPAVVRASREAEGAGHAGTDKPARLRRFVHGYISSKNLRRTYDSASVVATRREGDCTEHAVLLTALARLRRLPARVVHGIALVRAGGAWRAYGHAWVEVREKKSWAPLDAALESPSPIVYIPLAVLEDEGPARTLSLMGQLSPTDILRVRLTGPEGP